jgi:ferredoxin, 2Fe-2S
VTARVRIEPGGIELDVHDGETIMAAASRAGYRWPTVCGGHAECGVCALEVLSADATLPAPEPLEADRLATLPERRLRPDVHYRLACQLRGVDGLVVHKRGVVAVANGPR